MKLKIKVPGAGIIASMGILGVILFIAFWLGMVATTILGIYLAFSASILLGIIVIFVEPMPLVIGLVYLFTHMNIAEKIVEFFK